MNVPIDGLNLAMHIVFVYLGLRVKIPEKHNVGMKAKCVMFRSRKAKHHLIPNAVPLHLNPIVLLFCHVLGWDEKWSSLQVKMQSWLSELNLKTFLLHPGLQDSG